MKNLTMFVKESVLAPGTYFVDLVMDDGTVALERRAYDKAELVAVKFDMILEARKYGYTVCSK